MKTSVQQVKKKLPVLQIMRQQNYETPKENHDEYIIEDEISAQMETHCLSVNVLHGFYH